MGSQFRAMGVGRERCTSEYGLEGGGNEKVCDLDGGDGYLVCEYTKNHSWVLMYVFVFPTFKASLMLS